MWRSEREAIKHEQVVVKRQAWDAQNIDGKPNYTYKNQFTSLKVGNQLEQARDLGLKMVEAEERYAQILNERPNRWYTWETAIVLRKLKDKQGEINLLTRYLDACPPGDKDQKIADRLNKLQQ
jgi:hypothetical protein